MPDHYYSEHPQSKRITETIKTTLKGQSFTFTTSSGVFSRKGIDFGTKLLIENFKPPQLQGDLLDLGCGFGPIGVSLAHFYQERNIVMVDINERAVELAKLNVNENNITNALVKQSDGFNKLSNNTFASIITNPPIRAGKKVIYNLFKKSKYHLLDGGELWLVIQKKQGAPSAITYLTANFTEVETIVRKKGYYVIRAKK